MPRIKLILSDIDNTILPSGRARVSERTVAAFHAAMDAGIAVGPASGRGHAQIPPFFGGDEACCATCVSTNGLEVFHAGTCIAKENLPRPALEQTFELVRTLPHAGMLCFDGVQPLLVAGSISDLGLVAPGYAHICNVSDGLPTFDVLKANVFQVTDDAGTDELVRLLNERIDGLDFDKPMLGYTNVMPSGWNKGAAVKALCGHMGIGLDEVVVFGDAGNDLTMFEVVEHSVAVENATPEAAAAARWHIGACEDDAVAQAVEALAAGEWPFER